MAGTFHVTMRGEDGTVFTRECSAGSVQSCFDWAEELWPEAVVLEVFDPVKREEEIYQRVCRRMDDDDVYYDQD